MVIKDSKPFLLASAGGHVRELVALSLQMGLKPADVTWGTSRGRQLDDMTQRGWDTVEIPLCEPRDLFALLRALWPAFRIVRRLRPSEVLSTGSAVALPFAFAALLNCTRFTFVESLTRIGGPSKTGSMIELIPGIVLRSQTSPWMRRRGPFSRRWSLAPCSLDGYLSIPRSDPPTVRRLFVAVGVMTREYPFHRLFDKLEEISPVGVRIRVQGSGPRPGRRLETLPTLSRDELAREIELADAVIVHAGVGLTLDCFDCGRMPVVVPREAAFGEHVDEHQAEYAYVLATKKLAVTRTVAELTWTDIVESTTSRIETVETIKKDGPDVSM
jgi:UDP-N-acetylglucosamine--N-acetylmuramyl-(pentapeptide) pyrophosphoryl-undecaprenol N-acetylglucosamine transferase